MFRQVVSTADGTYFVSGVMPGVYELSAERAGFKRYSRRGIRLQVGKTATVDVGLEIGGLDEQLTVSGEGPIVDVTSKEVGGHITSGELTDLPSLNRSFIGFVALLPGIVPVTHRRFVRHGLRRCQRAGPPQQQLHARRRQQQRRRGRAVGGTPGTHPARGGAGVPGPDQPVRRGVLAHDGRGRERRHQAGHQRLARQRLRFRAGRLADPEGLLRQAGRPAQARHHLPAVRVHPGRPRRQEQGPLLRQRGAPGRRRGSHDQHPGAARPERDHHHARTGSGTRSSASTTRSAPATPGTCAGCGSTRWSRTSSRTV